jgi:hypothetical protein
MRQVSLYVFPHFFGNLTDKVFINRLTEASLALSAAAADNAEKDAIVKALHAKVAELEEKAAVNAAKSRDELAQMAKANAAEAEKNAKLQKAMAAVRLFLFPSGQSV